MFIPVGTIIKNKEDIRKYCHGRDVRIDECWLNDKKEFNVSEYYTTFTAIKSREYEICCEPTEDGYKVIKVTRFYDLE